MSIVERIRRKRKKKHTHVMWAAVMALMKGRTVMRVRVLKRFVTIMRRVVKFATTSVACVWDEQIRRKTQNQT